MKNNIFRNNKKPDRRGFLQITGGFIGGAFASYFANQFPSIDFHISDYLPTSSDLKESFSNIFLIPNEIKFHYGASHYLEKGVHSDNSFLGESVIKIVNEMMDIEKSEKGNDFELNNDDDWVLIGAPSSNNRTAEIMGIDNNKLISLDKKPFLLKYDYEYGDPNKLVDIKRYAASGKLQEQTVRALIVDGESGNKYGPDIGGWLEEDYLLVTRIPVIIKRNLKYRFVVGGTHGVGTRAFELLLKLNPFSLAEKKLLARSGSRPIQILAKVYAKHDGGFSEITGLDVIDVTTS